MRNTLRQSLRARQLITWKQAVAITSVTAMLVAGIVMFTDVFRTKPAYAAGCDFSYTLNWADPTTWTVNCGSVNASNWSVKGSTCSYFSPIFAVPGIIGGPARQVDISVRINQSGNLDGNDTAWVFLYSNGTLMNTYTFTGDSISAVFSVTKTLSVSSGGTYNVSIKCKNDKSNELWQIKNGDVTTCLKSISPLPVTITRFTAKPTTDNMVLLEWSTETEVNNNYFTIERSANGQQFTAIDTRDGAGTSNTPKSYRYIDQHPLPGLSYYRLRQTDYNGISATFTIVPVNRDANGSKPNELKVLPNPIGSRFTVLAEMEKDQVVRLQLVSMQGVLLYNREYQVTEGTNSLEVNLDNRPAPGIYSVRLFSQGTQIGSAKAVCR